MGVDLAELVVKHERCFEEFRKKRIAIDAYNTLYQFLASIRQRDGTPLMDFQGKITSHLSGLFYRTVNFIKFGIKPVYVFDGKPPQFKKRELEEREERKKEAKLLYEKAADLEETEEMAKYAKQFLKLTKEMVEESKELLKAMGCTVVQAPSEGEAQAAYMARKGSVYASASQDYDSLLFGSPRLIRNLTISGKRKLPRRDEYVEIHPEEIFLEEVLKAHGISREQLILIGLLVGTDYNEGVKGVGVKKALQLVKSQSIDNVKKFIIVKDHSISDDYHLEQIYNFFLNPPVEDVEIREGEMDKDKIIEILVERHDFSKERVNNAILELEEAYRRMKQHSLTEFFG